MTNTSLPIMKRKAEARGMSKLNLTSDRSNQMHHHTNSAERSRLSCEWLTRHSVQKKKKKFLHVALNSNFRKPNGLRKAGKTRRAWSCFCKMFCRDKSVIFIKKCYLHPVIILTQESKYTVVTPRVSKTQSLWAM